MKKQVMMFFYAFAMCASFIATAATTPEKATEVQEEQKVENTSVVSDEMKQLPDSQLSPKAQAARARGRILYKRSVIRKAEKAACAANPELRARIDQLEAERRTQFIAADAKLKEMYAEVDAMEKALEQQKEKK